MKFYYYVLNYNTNKRKVEPFNIFDNCLVQENVEREVAKFLRNKKAYGGFGAFVESLKGTLMWQEWARYEYEMSVGEPFPKDLSTMQKVDCYQQALPNIECIAREVIYQYKEAKKKNVSISD